MARTRWQHHGLRVLRVGLLIGAVGLLAVQGWYFGWVVYYGDHNPEATAFMALRREQARTQGRNPELAHQWVDLDAISPWLRRAVIAAEDARFMDHNGLDWEALHKAMKENLEADEVVRGGSTISQQLAKNLFLSPQQTYLRKAQEAAITLMLEATMSKQRILALYLNSIEWGRGLFGVEAAARHYYGISAAQLNRWQAATLAARIPRARYYDRHGTTTFLLQRAGDIAERSNRVATPANTPSP